MWHVSYNVNGHAFSFVYTIALNKSTPWILADKRVTIRICIKTNESYNYFCQWILHRTITSVDAPEDLVTGLVTEHDVSSPPSLLKSMMLGFSTVVPCSVVLFYP